MIIVIYYNEYCNFIIKITTKNKNLILFITMMMITILQDSFVVFF
jgi:hypothetical protein